MVNKLDSSFIRSDLYLNRDNIRDIECDKQNIKTRKTKIDGKIIILSTALLLIFAKMWMMDQNAKALDSSLRNIDKDYEKCLSNCSDGFSIIQDVTRYSYQISNKANEEAKATLNLLVNRLSCQRDCSAIFDKIRDLKLKI